MPSSYPTQCYNCLSSFDAIEAVWCSCNPQRPTKVCPFCLGCFCAAGEDFREKFWKDAPADLGEEMKTLAESRMLIGDMLVRAGVISTSQLLDALKRQKKDGRRLGEILAVSGALTHERLEEFLQSQHTATQVDLARARIDTTMIRRLGVDRCLELRIVPLEPEPFRDRQIMTLVMADPSQTPLIDTISQETGCQIIAGVAPAEEIVAVIRSIYPQGAATLAEAPTITELGPDAPVEDPLCRKLLAGALKRRASHIQFVDRKGACAVHYRIDGTMFRDRAIPAKTAAAALTAFRTATGLSDGSTGHSRTGRTVFRLDELDYRVIARAPDRRDVLLSLKILDPIGFPPRLDDLNLPIEVVDALRDSVKGEAGLVVISAPPMSGATGTAYAISMDLLEDGRPLALVETPRRVWIEEVIQEEYFLETPASLGEALTRATDHGARVLSLPDDAGMGWIRTHTSLPARMIVICRLEAPSLAGALGRLVALGYTHESLARHGTYMLHQRLLRRNCGNCRKAVGSSAGDSSAPPRFRRGTGCSECGPIPGVRGRFPLAHGLNLTQEVLDAVSSGDEPRIDRALQDAGVPPLTEVAAEAIEAGLINVDEIDSLPGSRTQQIEGSPDPRTP